MELVGLDTLQATLGHSDTDWKVVTDEELPGLERRIQDMLRAIESYEVPDVGEGGAGASKPKPKPTISSSSATAKDKRKSQRGTNKSTSSSSAATTEDTTSMRLLADDFMELPLDSIPNYASLVPRMLSIEVSLSLRIGRFCSYASL